MKARPTIYNGIQMRSRLEARVAAMLDENGIRWEYEPMAFASGRSQYLPDFSLPDLLGRLPVYLEVRPDTNGVDAAVEQMTVIRQSQPDAILITAEPEAMEIGCFYVNLIREWKMKGFVRCPCGRWAIGHAAKYGDAFGVKSWCVCGDVAFREDYEALKLPRWDA